VAKVIGSMGGVLTQHPLYFLRTHSRASFCAVERSAGVIFLATTFLFHITTE
jgi:hypothetical protein